MKNQQALTSLLLTIMALLPLTTCVATITTGVAVASPVSSHVPYLLDVCAFINTGKATAGMLLDNRLAPPYSGYNQQTLSIAMGRKANNVLPDGLNFFNIERSASSGDQKQSQNTSIEVSGTVTDEQGQPLPGVNILVKGATTGTVTDIDGKYRIELLSADVVLVFSSIGYRSEEVAVAGKTVIDVRMVPDVKSLQEIVIVGYGTQKKADLSSAISTLSAKEISTLPGGFQAGLQSSVPGVQITGDKIRIRGVGSINSTDPLYVVDGMIGGVVPNENNIESVQILKDAASCAIYGARGANGVILVTTKRGMAGPTKVDYTGYAGVKEISNKVDLLNGQQLAELINEEMYNANPSRTDYLAALSDPAAIGTGYNMMDALLQKGKYQMHNLAVSGGSEKATFRVNGTYSTDESFIVKDKSKNYVLQFLSNFSLGKKIKLGETLNLTVNTRKWSDKAFIEAQKWSSTMPIYDASSASGFGGAGNGTDTGNPLATANFNWDESESLGLNGNFWVTYEFLPRLIYKFNVGVDMYKNRDEHYDAKYYVGQYQSNPTDDLSIGSAQNNRFLFENTLSYDKSFGKHNVSALLGLTSEESEYKSLNASASSFPSPSMRILNLTQDQNSKFVGSSIDNFAFYSLLGRINYDYESRYMLTVNFRRDGSSNFGASNRYGNFPSFSAAWRISQETFMQGISLISDLKVRGSYGILGNANIAHYQYQGTVSFDNIWYYFNGTKVTGALPVNPANPDVKWESQYSKGVGLDLAMLNDKLLFTIDYFNKRTEDMLVNVPISYANGYIDNFPVLNKGSIRNKGLEFLATYRNSIGKLNYSVSGNFTTVHNEVLDLGNSNEIFAGNVNPSGDNVTRTAVGSAIGQFWGYITNGLYTRQDQLEADKTFAPKAALGDVRFVDKDGDGALTAKDKGVIGNPIPKLSYGLTFNATYDFDFGRIDFAMTWQGSHGNDIYNNSKSWGEGMYHYYNDFATTLDRYRAEELVFVNPVSGVTTVYPKNTDTDMPRAVLGDPNQNLRASDRFIEDGSYVRLKYLTIGYGLPGALLDKLKVANLRLYVGGKNLLTFTDYTGFDPEVASDNGASNGRYNLNRGIDSAVPWGITFPNSKEYFVGLQLSF